ncbi:MAG: hypothetical protein LBL59_09100 [Xanthomonadaceae bacterium]|jgi:hypothetical protein|nr:hypothetical protein [Xanthomonadaceae bacterium]
MNLIQSGNVGVPDSTIMARVGYPRDGKDAMPDAGRWTEPMQSPGHAGILRRLRAILPDFIETESVVDCSNDPLYSIRRALRGAEPGLCNFVSVTLRLSTNCVRHIRDRGPSNSGRGFSDIAPTAVQCLFGNWRAATSPQWAQLLGCRRFDHAAAYLSALPEPDMPVPLMPQCPYAYCSHAGKAILVLVPDQEQAIFRAWI